MDITIANEATAIIGEQTVKAKIESAISVVRFIRNQDAGTRRSGRLTADIPGSSAVVWIEFTANIPKLKRKVETNQGNRSPKAFAAVHRSVMIYPAASTDELPVSTNL